MKALICPQCGGKITDYKPWDNFAVCGYCETKFVITTEKPKPIPIPPPPIPETNNQPIENTSLSQNAFVAIISGVLLLIIAIISIGVIAGNKASKADYSTRTTPAYPYRTPTPTPVFSPTPVDNPNLLEFGGTGTSTGSFQNADAIAVDAKGRIYVGDESLRVQQFDDKGNFIKLWQIPSQTANYKRARAINKIAVANDESVFIAVGGVILVYKQDSETAVQTIHFAPDYIVDFALRTDGGIVTVSSDDEIETLTIFTKSKKITRRIQGFQTDAADAAMSPAETGFAAVRLAVDGAGNIFSIYALGDLGSYQLSYNEEDFQIFRFSPEGKFVDKFAQSKDSVGIAVDNQSRIYVSEGTNIGIYSKDGKPLGAIPNLNDIEDFTLDRQNNVYVIQNDHIIKRAAVE